MSKSNDFIDTPMGKIPVSWGKYNLEEISEFITKGATPTTYGFKWEESGIPFLRSECVSENGFIESGISFISEEANNVMQRSKVQSDDILISITGNVGRIAIYPKKYDSGNINQHIARVRINKTEIADRLFVYHQINQPNYRNYYNGIVTGAAYPQLSLKQIRETPVYLPPLETQKRIANILSTYDDLIENNLKRIKLLEETAQNIYKEWFVNFRFPNYEHTEFDGESGLPKGWEKLELNNIADVLSSKRVFLSDYVESGVPFYRGKEITQKSNFINISELYYITEEKFLELEAKSGSPKEGDILITGVGTIGNSYLINEFDEKFYFKDGNLLWIRNIDKKISPEYLIQYLKSNDFKGVVDSISIGSSQKALTISALKSIKILIPEQDLINNYTSKTKVLLKQVNTLYEGLKILKEARDILLPRLMNRTIEV
jgi:type I restriction enzyme S subunit